MNEIKLTFRNKKKKKKKKKENENSKNVRNVNGQMREVTKSSDPCV